MTVKYAKTLPLEDYAEEAANLLRMLVAECPRSSCYCAADAEPCLTHGRAKAFTKVRYMAPEQRASRKVRP